MSRQSTLNASTGSIGLLVQVTIFDPVTLLAVGAILSSVAFVAAYLPARKAARFDPAVSLRAE